MYKQPGKMPRFWVELIEAAPLPVFLVYAGLIDKSVAANWLGPYVAGAFVAAASTSLLLFKGVALNRIFIGINLYLFSGSIGLLTHQGWLNTLYGELQASGMLAWIVAVGIGSLAISPKGFVGLYSENRGEVIVFSIYLLLAAVTAFIISYSFRGNKIFSELLPFVLLFATHSFLRARLALPFTHK